MKKFAAVALVLSVVSLPGCGKKNDPYTHLRPGEIVITGQVTNIGSKDSKVLKFNFFNPLDPYDSRAVRIDPQDGTFEVRYTMPFPQDFTIDYRKFIYCYGGPGDSIHLKIDYKELDRNGWSGVEFSGDRAEFNNHFWRTHTDMEKVMLKGPYFEPNDSEPDEYIHYMERVQSDLFDTLRAYGEAHGVPGSVLTHYRRVLTDAILYYSRMSYKGEDDSPEALGDQSKVHRSAVFDLYNPSNFASQMYQYNLDAMGYYIMENDPQCMELLDNQAYGALADRLYELYNAETTEITVRDAMLFAVCRMFAERGEPAPVLFGKMAGYLSSDYAKDRLHAMIQAPEVEPVAVDRVLYLTPDGETEELATPDFIGCLTEKYPGKVLYIDAWATWCSWCIRVFPQARELKQALAGEEVVFIYLCLNSTEKEWKKKVEETELSDAENYYFRSDDGKMLRSGLQIQGFPTYILVGRDGTSIDPRAPGPGAPAASEIIRNLAKR